MTQPADHSFSSDFKRFFLKGLVVLLPTVLTLWLVVKAYQFVDNSFAEPINQGVRLTLYNATPYWEPLQDWFEPTPEEVESQRSNIIRSGTRVPERATIAARLRRESIRTWWDDHWYMDLIGLVFAIVGVYIAGRLLGGFFGRRIYRRLEQFITTLPVFKQVYPHVKQVVDFLFSDEKPIKFNRVVVVEYPSKGIWSVGFQTGQSLKAVAEKAGDSVTIFIPSSPTPFTGYTITVPRDEVRELPLTVEEAIRFAVSGGVLIPEHQLSQLPSPEEIAARKEAEAEAKDRIPLASEPSSGTMDDTSALEKDEGDRADERRRDAG